MTPGYYTIENKAKRYYGTTEVPQFAGYLLKDGEMLNFSYEGYQRDEDHRNISQFFKQTRYDGSFSRYMIKFMRRGNIRVSCNNNCYGFEFAKTPTREQWHALSYLHKEAEREGLSFIIEKTSPDGYGVCKSFYDFNDFVEWLSSRASYYLY